MIRRNICLLFLAILIGGSAAAEEMTEVRAAGIRAAHAEAFQNLTSRLYGMTAGRQTAEAVVMRDAELRGQVEAALIAAARDTGPYVDRPGIVTVVLTFDTNVLPFNVRNEIRDLPRYLRADGVAHEGHAFEVEQRNVTDLPEVIAAWAEEPVEATAQHRVRQARTDADRESARRQAALEALDSLRDQVYELRIGEDVTIGSFLEAHPDLRPAVNGLLAGALGGPQLVSERIDDDGRTYTAEMKLTVPPNLLLRALRIGPWRAIEATPMTGSAMDLARTNAFRNARRQLRRKIDSIELATGERASTLIERREGVREEIDQLIERQPIRLVEFTPAGMARVHVQIRTDELPAAVTRFARRDDDPIIRATGGGISVHVDEADENENEQEEDE